MQASKGSSSTTATMIGMSIRTAAGSTGTPSGSDRSSGAHDRAHVGDVPADQVAGCEVAPPPQGPDDPVRDLREGSADREHGELAHVPCEPLGWPRRLLVHLSRSAPAVQHRPGHVPDQQGEQDRAVEPSDALVQREEQEQQGQPERPTEPAAAADGARTSQHEQGQPGDQQQLRLGGHFGWVRGCARSRSRAPTTPASAEATKIPILAWSTRAASS